MSEQGVGKKEFWFVETQKYVFSKYNMNPKWIPNDVKIHVVNASYVEQLEKEKAELVEALTNSYCTQSVDLGIVCRSNQPTACPRCKTLSKLGGRGNG